MHKLFENFQTDRMMCFMSSMKGYLGDNLNFPVVGKMLEMAIAEFSAGSLVRINEIGKDLKAAMADTTVESKGVQFQNKFGMDIRRVTIKNSRQAKEWDGVLADLFVFPDIVNGKMAVVTSDRIYNIRDNGATVTASVDCVPEDFLFFGYGDVESSRDYFEIQEKFQTEFIRSF